MSCQLITPSFVWPEHRFLRLIAHHWARAGMGLIEGSTDRGLADQQFDSVMATVRMDQPDQHLFQGQPWPTCPGMDKQSVRVVAFYQLALDQLHLGSSFELWLIKTPRTAHICAYKHVIKHSGSATDKDNRCIKSFNGKYPYEVNFSYRCKRLGVGAYFCDCLRFN